jgi:hypothetical protein
MTVDPLARFLAVVAATALFLYCVWLDRAE